MSIQPLWGPPYCIGMMYASLEVDALLLFLRGSPRYILLQVPYTAVNDTLVKNFRLGKYKRLRFLPVFRHGSKTKWR